MTENELRSLIRDLISESGGLASGARPEDLRFSMNADYDVRGISGTLGEIAQNLRAVSSGNPDVLPFADFFEALAGVPVATGGMRTLFDALELDDAVIEDWHRVRHPNNRGLNALFSTVFGRIAPQARHAAGGSAEYLEYLGSSLRLLEQELAAVTPAELRLSAALGRGLHAIATRGVADPPALLKDLKAAKRRLGGWGEALEEFLESQQ